MHAALPKDKVMIQRHNRKLERIARMTSALALASVLVPVFVAIADEEDGGGGVAGAKNCTASWTDCNGISNSVNWSCPSGTQCCKVVWKRRTSDPAGCVDHVDTSCGSGGPGCNETRWITTP